jgi:hypothetical protein
MYIGWLGNSAVRVYKAGLFLTGSSEEQYQKVTALRAFEPVSGEIIISICSSSMETATKEAAV